MSLSAQNKHEQEFATFLNKFKTALASNDKKQVADCMEFPFVCNDDTISRTKFLTKLKKNNWEYCNYYRLFDRDVRAYFKEIMIDSEDINFYGKDTYRFAEENVVSIMFTYPPTIEYDDDGAEIGGDGGASVEFIFMIRSGKYKLVRISYT
jgi:hypothetical protein